MFFRSLCLTSGIPWAARAHRKLFMMETIAPTSTAYAHISQKILKGAASRLIIFWLAALLYDQAIQPGASKAAKWLGFFQGFEMVDS